MYRAMSALAGDFNLKSLKTCVSAGEALPDATRQLFKQASGIEIVDGIGSTEMIHCFISHTPERGRRGATGYAIPGYQAAILNENRDFCKPGEIGRLAVNGPHSCRYLAVQVSARRRVRRHAAAHRDRKNPTLQAEAIRMNILQPPGWARAKGFSNGIAASGKLVFIAGQIGWTGEGKWEARDFAGQFRQALLNVITVLKEARGKPEHLVRLTWYVLDRQEYLNSLKGVGIAYRA